MKSVRTIRALFLATSLSIATTGIVTVAAVSTAQAQDKSQKVSEKVGKPLQAAVDAVKIKQFDVAAEKIREAEAAPKKSAFEQYKINTIWAHLYIAQKKYAELGSVFEKYLETPQFLPPEQSAILVKNIAQTYYQAQQYAKSAEFSKRWLKDHPGDTEIQALLGQTYYLLKDYKQAREQMNIAVSTAEKAGQEPKEVWLQIAQACSVELGDEAGITAAYEKLVRYHPKADYWERLLKTQSRGERSDRAMFQWFRLMTDVKALKSADQYMEFAQLGLDNMPGEALRALQSGYETKILGADPKSKERHDRLLASVKTKADQDRQQLAQIEKEAAASTAATGQLDAGLGLAYFSFEMYDQAIQALEKGLKKGGLKNPDDYRLTLGIAQLRKGQKDQARASFKAIPADSPLAKVASMWVIRSYN